MRTLAMLFAATTLSVGSIGVASAQVSEPVQPSPAAEAPASVIMTGDSVYNFDGEEIGSIEDVNIDATGDQNAVLSVGEFLGLGGKQVLIPASELSARAEGGYTVNYTQEQLEQMPEHQAAD